jgi:hypothetical protein
MGRLSEIHLEMSLLPAPEQQVPRNEIQDLEHAAVIAMVAEGFAVLLFITAVAV